MIKVWKLQKLFSAYETQTVGVIPLGCCIRQKPGKTKRYDHRKWYGSIYVLQSVQVVQTHNWDQQLG